MSEARFATYRKLATGSDDLAWRLYRWNIELVAAGAPLLCDVEVALRNRLHSQLSAHFGREDWWASSALALDDQTSEVLMEAVARHQKNIDKGTVGAGKVVADLMLGTWVLLLGRGGTSKLGRAFDYEKNLWRPALSLGFDRGTRTPKGRVRRPTRDEVHRRAANVQRLRNRAAHHEPIMRGILAPGTSTRVPLLDVWDGAIELLGWIAPELAAEHRDERRLPGVFATCPVELMP